MCFLCFLSLLLLSQFPSQLTLVLAFIALFSVQEGDNSQPLQPAGHSLAAMGKVHPYSKGSGQVLITMHLSHVSQQKLTKT